MDAEDLLAYAIAALLVLVAVPALFVYNVLTYGFALSVLWGWFIVPAFGLPALSLVQAYGVALVGGLAFSRVPRGDASGEWWATVLLQPWVALGMGWILTFWV